MRNISFSLTTRQIRERSKTVTRRLNWLNVKVGDRLQGCEKCMGRRHGEPLVKLAVIEVVSVRRENLSRMTDELNYGIEEVKREGFAYFKPESGWPAKFVRFFCEAHKGCTPETLVTRIEFKYVE